MSTGPKGEKRPADVIGDLAYIGVAPRVGISAVLQGSSVYGDFRPQPQGRGGGL